VEDPPPLPLPLPLPPPLAVLFAELRRRAGGLMAQVVLDVVDASGTTDRRRIPGFREPLLPRWSSPEDADDDDGDGDGDGDDPSRPSSSPRLLRLPRLRLRPRLFLLRRLLLRLLPACMAPASPLASLGSRLVLMLLACLPWGEATRAPSEAGSLTSREETETWR
jgi:hypothetical protein